MSTFGEDVKPRIILDPNEAHLRTYEHSDDHGQPSGDVEGERHVRRAIENAASKNTALLNDIGNTEVAVSELQNNESRLRHAMDELSVQEAAVRKAEVATKVQLQRYTRQRDSFSRKWYYRLTRMRQNFEAKVKEAEQAYHEVIATQSKTENRKEELQKDMNAIEYKIAQLSGLAKKHMEAHEAIDKLYASLFEGPTPGFPDEDEREQRFKSEKAEHDATTKTLKSMTKASREAQMLKVAIEKAQSEIKRADYETDTAFFVSEYVSIWVERTMKFVERAQQLHGDVLESLPQPRDRNFVRAHQDLGRGLSSTRQNITSLLQLDYPSRYQLNDSLILIAEALTISLDEHAEMERAIKDYLPIAKQAVNITARSLEDSRQALQEIRQGAFEITVGFSAAAPPYHECCDRAEGFENDSLAQCQRIPDPTVDDLPPPPSYERAVQ